VFTYTRLVRGAKSNFSSYSRTTKDVYNRKPRSNVSLSLSL
jgi:hypothetical protein